MTGRQFNKLCVVGNCILIPVLILCCMFNPATLFYNEAGKIINEENGWKNKRPSSYGGSDWEWYKISGDYRVNINYDYRLSNSLDDEVFWEYEITQISTGKQLKRVGHINSKGRMQAWDVAKQESEIALEAYTKGAQ